jgi:hypothetical protein
VWYNHRIIIKANSGAGTIGEAHCAGCRRGLRPRHTNHQWREMDARSQATASPPPSYNPDGASERAADGTARGTRLTSELQVNTSTRSPSTPEPTTRQIDPVDGRRQTGHEHPSTTANSSPGAQRAFNSLDNDDNGSVSGYARDARRPFGTAHRRRRRSSELAGRVTAVFRPVSINVRHHPTHRRHRQRATISPEDTLYNLGCHLLEKEITIRHCTRRSQSYSSMIIRNPYFQPLYVTQLKFLPPPHDLPLSEEAYATDISFIAN